MQVCFVSRPSVIIRFPDQDEVICGIIDNRVEGLETGSINTASRADSSMFLVLRPLIVFEMAACSNATAPFVEPITQLNKKNVNCIAASGIFTGRHFGQCFVGQCRRNLWPVLLYILVKQTWIWNKYYSILVDNILVTQNNILVTKQTLAMRLGTCGMVVNSLQTLVIV